MPSSSSESNGPEREPEPGTRPSAPRNKVGIADYAVTTAPGVLSTSGLGSCLAIVLFDRSAAVAGLLHAMLPAATAGAESTAKFVDTGVEAMLAELQEAGATPGAIEAKIAGGSTMLDLTAAEGSIGDRNVDATRRVLATHGISVVAEDVGGEYGRSVQFDVATTELRIKTAYRGECTI